MRRQPYPTDLTDAEWSILEPLIPPAKPGGRPRDVDMREILNAAFYVHRETCSWRHLPPDFPPWQTVYCYVRRWRQDGTWETMQTALREATRGYEADNGAPGTELVELALSTTNG